MKHQQTDTKRIVFRVVTRLAACLAGLSSAALWAAEAPAQEDADALKMPKSTVVGVPADDTAADNLRTVSADTVAARTGPGQTNPYKALDLLPSVHIGQADNYGLSLDQNSFRIRGLYADTFSRLAQTVNGVPSVVNVGQGAMGSTIDMENVGAMTLVSGAPAADGGFGFGDNAGSLDLAILKPASTPALLANESFGSESFSRTFVRGDSGRLPGGFSSFLSGSYSSVEKWRGAGKSHRSNVEGEVAVLSGSPISASVFVANNIVNRNDYLPLTYAQSRNLGANDRLDFSTSLTGTPAKDKFYYDFNRQDFRETLVQGELAAAPGVGALSLKPYYIRTDGYRLATASLTNTTPTVSKVEISQNQYGLLSEYALKTGPVETKVGYWYQSIRSIPPPTAQKTYTVNTAGNLVFSGWGMLNKVGDRVSNSPFFALKATEGDWGFQAGYRYLWFKQPEVQGYTTTGLGDVSDGAARAAATPDATLHTNGVTLKAGLPEAMISYRAATWALLKLSYGAGYASPWEGPLWSTYKSNQTVFTAHGISIQKLWDGMKLEKSDHFEVSGQVSSGPWQFTALGYLAEYRDKQASVYDPVVNLKYYQNAAKAEGSGTEGTLRYAPGGWFEAFTSLSYNLLEFTADIPTASGAVVAAKGKQVPDAPNWLWKSGVVLRKGGFSFSPVVRFVDTRYGDVLNTEHVPSYAVVDLTTSYSGGAASWLKDWTVAASVQNLFGRHYIAIVKNDLDDTGTGGAAYYPGAPVSVVGTVSLKF